MKYKNIVEAKFIRKLNRFAAEVEVDGEIKLAHLPATARLRELLIPGATCYLVEATNKNRKTPYTLTSIVKNGEILNIVSTVANDLVYNSIVNGEILSNLKIKDLKKEVKFSNSRFDMGFTTEDGKEGFIEVKSVNLKRNNIAMFPGSPTQRGRKHLKELSHAKREGKIAVLVIVVLFEDMDYFTANIATDPEWSKELLNSIGEGVEIYAYNSKVKEDSIEIKEKVRVDLGYSIEKGNAKNKFLFKKDEDVLGRFKLTKVKEALENNFTRNEAEDYLLLSEVEILDKSVKSVELMISFAEQLTSDKKLDILKIETKENNRDKFLEEILIKIGYEELNLKDNNSRKIFKKFVDK